MSDKTFRIALVGCGRISKNHVEAIDRVDGLSLVAACDEDAERARALAEPRGIPWFTSYEEMLEKVQCEVVAICTPSGLHPAQGVLAAKTGHHVVTEKPMAISLRGADELVAACDAAKVNLFVVKQNRLNAPVQLLKRAVDRGRFGRIYLANCTVRWTRPQEYYEQAPWRGTWEFDGGAFMNQASHYIDLIQWIVGPVENVMAKTATLARKIETEDTGVAILRFRSGALGVIEVDRRQPDVGAILTPVVGNLADRTVGRDLVRIDAAGSGALGTSDCQNADEGNAHGILRCTRCAGDNWQSQRSYATVAIVQIAVAVPSTRYGLKAQSASAASIVAS